MKTNVNSIPKELKTIKQWVCWVGSDKTPKNPYTGGNAMSNNKDTWGTIDDAVSACDKYGFDGVGFMFAPPYFGVDLDHCIDKADFCDEFVETLESYAEISKSGTGIHIICKGKLPDGGRRKNGVEMYSSGRYFIFTGNIYNEKYKEIKDCTESIKVLHAKYLPSSTPSIPNYTRVSVDLSDEELINKARNAKTGTVFNLLYTGQWEGLYYSQSEADMAFCNHLAFWTGCNEEQMDRIFRSSGLMRDKWDTKRGSETYGKATIGKACAQCKNVYNPQTDDNDSSLAVAFFGNGGSGTTDDGATTAQYALTDTGNAHRLYDRFGRVIRYSYNRKKWYFWTGKSWEIDDSGEIKKLADEICNDLKRQAYNSKDDETKEQLLKFASKTETSRNKEAMIKECQHLNEIPTSPDSFDAYADYLNCQNGIVNLRNGELIPHDSNFMMSKITSCEYDVSHKKPQRWLSFLDDVTNGDKELQAYIQKCVGYSLSGSNQEQCAYFLYGLGNNGKSTFLDTISDMLGTYASNAQPDTIMMQSRIGSSGGGANSDIARLKSIRFVTCEEPTEGVRLNEGLLKQLTGGSRVTCRFLYGDEFEYVPEFKIWVATNHKPTIRGTDFGIWRRVKLIPFEVNIPKEKVDKNLKYKLRQEFPQILAWAVEGCLKWKSEGIQEPTCVLDATKDYKKEMDLVGTFVDQCMTIDYDSHEKIMANDIFSLYTKWAKLNNEYEMTSKKFYSELAKKVPEKGRSAKGVYFACVVFTDFAKELMGHNYQFNEFK